MNDRNEDLFEAELQRLKPARPPEEFIKRLVATRPVKRLPTAPRARTNHLTHNWQWWLRWLAPAAAAAAVVGLLVLRTPGPARVPENPSEAVPVDGPLPADGVEIDRRLVAAYDAVAQLPGGEPVRFRFSEWTDKVVWRDTDRGVEIEQSTPRVEVVPVAFEIY